MALTRKFVRTHIAQWEQQLKNPYYPYREKWPSRLFHHSPIENAARMLKDGNLRSRNDEGNARERDVAAAEVLGSRSAAHNYARLYFRPKTPTQWHIEGIRKEGECRYAEAHAPVLTMFVFDAESVLSQTGIQFSDRNMQIIGTPVGSSQDEFSQIPFAKVYHEGGTANDPSITAHRCAEVLATSPLELETSLQWVYCRSAGERDSLLFLLGNGAKKWSDRIKISDDLLVFHRNYAFVEEVVLNKAGIIFKFNPRRDGKPIAVTVKVKEVSAAANIISYENAAMAPVPAKATRWQIERELKPGTYRVVITIEGHLAYKNRIVVSDKVF